MPPRRRPPEPTTVTAAKRQRRRSPRLRDQRRLGMAPSPTERGTPRSRAPSTGFARALIAHSEIFFEVFLGFLEAEEIAALGESLLTEHGPGSEIFGDPTPWRYLMARAGMRVPRHLRGQAAPSTHPPPLVLELTVSCHGACREASEYLSLLSQMRSFDHLVTVVAGDLETITHIEGATIDCIAFPTSAALVNPGIGVASCVFRRAGPRLQERLTTDRRRHGLFLAPGDVTTTAGFDAGVSLLVHCVGPAGFAADRRILLYRTYWNALREIRQHPMVQSAAFASISTGTLRYPLHEAAEVAMLAIRDTVRTCNWKQRVTIVCIDRAVQDAFIAAKTTVRRSFFGNLAFPDPLG